MLRFIGKIFTRETAMFCLGAFGFLHELILGHAERPFLLALSGALMGLPFVLSADTKFSNPPKPGTNTPKPKRKPKARD